MTALNLGTERGAADITISEAHVPGEGLLGVELGCDVLELVGEREQIAVGNGLSFIIGYVTGREMETTSNLKIYMGILISPQSIKPISIALPLLPNNQDVVLQKVGFDYRSL